MILRYFLLYEIPQLLMVKSKLDAYFAFNIQIGGKDFISPIS